MGRMRRWFCRHDWVQYTMTAILSPLVVKDSDEREARVEILMCEKCGKWEDVE